VSIPEDVVLTLARAGTIADSDFMDTQRYRLADGSEQSSRRFRIRSLRIGSIELRNVVASIVPAEGELLLGQSFLSRLKSWSIDNNQHVLLLNEAPQAQPPLPTAAAAPGGPRVHLPAPQPLLPPAPRRSPEDQFRDALAYLLTVENLSELRVVDRAQCVVEVRDKMLAGPDVVTVLHLNNVDLAQSEISVSKEAGPTVKITLRGAGVAEYPERAAFEGDGIVIPAEPASSSSTHTITLYTNEYGRVLRAWGYIYSYGCKGLRSAGALTTPPPQE
jgi:hypothetical protein